MKKFFAILATLVVTTFAFNAKAQFSDIEGMPPYKFGVTAGFNMPWVSGASGDYEMRAGFQVGANLMIDASEMLPNTFARVEAKYSMKGARLNMPARVDMTEGLISNMKDRVSLHYLEVPIHYGYAWYINDDVTLMAETGPYIAVGLYGRHHVESDLGNGSSNAFGNRLDLGWGAQASVMFAKNYQLHVAYDYGFINVSDALLQNRNLSIGLTWFFESLFE